MQFCDMLRMNGIVIVLIIFLILFFFLYPAHIPIIYYFYD